MAASRVPPSWAASPAFRRAPRAFRVGALLADRAWRHGALTVRLPNGETLNIEGAEPGPAGELLVRDYRFVRRVLAGADIGFGEGYMAGEWETPDLSALLCAFTANFDALGQLVTGHPLVSSLARLADLFQRNSRAGSRRNIHAHYDLGNRFYAAWLDATMTYSSAMFASGREPLEAAQRAKYAALADRIELKPGERVLEVGCGWGGFAEYAAAERGARVTALTISKAQCDFARQRLFERGLADRAEVRLADYREVEGTFDKLASIEMFEAVGEAYWSAFFAKLREALRPGGLAAMQVITIRDDLFDLYRRRSDFLRRYIFPGGLLPSEARLRQETARAGLEWRDIRHFGDAYARTLAEWGARFEAAWDEIRAQGFDERFRRLWRFYLSYCEAGMRTERTNVVQLALARP